MGKWIRRRYKSSHTSASPQESFWRGRWIWIPIRKRIVHIQVICYDISAAQISTPFLQRRHSSSGVICGTRFLQTLQIKMQLNEVAGGNHSPNHLPSSPPPIHPSRVLFYWSIKKKKHTSKRIPVSAVRFREHRSQPDANDAWWKGGRWAREMKMHVGAWSKHKQWDLITRHHK